MGHKMYVSEHTVIVNKPIDVVFKNLACLKGCINWSTLLHATEKLDDAPTGVGTRYKHTAGFMGMTSETIQTVRLYNPPYEFAFGDDKDASLPVQNHYTLTEVPEGTQVHLQMTLSPQGGFIGKIATGLLVGRIQKQMDNDLNNFKELVEDGVTIHA